MFNKKLKKDLEYQQNLVSLLIMFIEEQGFIKKLQKWLGKRGVKMGVRRK
jgi:hypothetical protein